jgi:hypothetical protein
VFIILSFSKCHLEPTWYILANVLSMPFHAYEYSDKNKYFCFSLFSSNPLFLNLFVNLFHCLSALWPVHPYFCLSVFLSFLLSVFLSVFSLSSFCVCVCVWVGGWVGVFMWVGGWVGVLSVCLFTYFFLSRDLSIYQSIFISVCLSILYLSVCLSYICLSNLYLSVHPISVCPSYICLSICLPIYLYTFTSVYLFICLCMCACVFFYYFLSPSFVFSPLSFLLHLFPPYIHLSISLPL